MAETIVGFNIPLRPLTEEEATREITLDRFNEFHQLAGEDFCDTVGTIVNCFVFGGWLMAKNPEFSKEILEKLNEPWIVEPLDFNYIYEEHYPYAEHGDVFYKLFAEFLNQTEAAKERVNQVLIQVAETYKR